ncbi:MAG: arginine--tRNA ligase [Tissierellia bacterium]|nr:arginine--tRNA ligase [Tissierellia bacterium]
MKDLKKEISNLLIKNDVGLKEDEIISLIEIPPNQEMGDFAFPCFTLAKKFRKNPAIIAKEIASEIESDLFEKIENVNAYINFYVDKKYFVNNVINEVLEQKYNYGSSNMGQGKNIILEYSSPNIAKPFHIGHIRTTIIGDVIKRVYKHLGYNTIAINYIGDYGTQFGVMIAAYKLWGDKEKINKDPINELLNLYVRYNKEAEENPEMMDKAREYFNKLENNDAQAVELWTWFKEISLREFERVYKLLNIEFDNYNGEAYSSKWIPDVIEELKQKELLTYSDGAYIVDLEKYDLTPVIIIKSNNSSTYITRDIATAINRMREYNYDENIYVVATQQNLHFQQWKKVLELMGYDFFDKCIHVGFGMVSMKGGTLSTRKGQVIFLEDVLNKAIEKTKEIIENRNEEIENKDEVAQKVGIGAVKFQELYNSRIKDYVFDWVEVLNFDGETGPYVQYTYARAKAVLRKANYKQEFKDLSYDDITSDIEYSLVKSLESFKDSIIRAKDKYEPSIVTRKVTEIAKNFNKFYNNISILVDDENLKNQRLNLTYATSIVIKTGLGLLGIDTVEKM